MTVAPTVSIYIEFVYFSSHLQGKEYFLGHPVTKFVWDIKEGCVDLSALPDFSTHPVHYFGPRRAYALSAWVSGITGTSCSVLSR